MSRPERSEKVATPDAHEAALTVKTVGWLLLVHDALFVALFMPAGSRDGSKLWSIWTLAEGFAGLTLLATGSMMEERAKAAEGAAPERERTRKAA